MGHVVFDHVAVAGGDPDQVLRRYVVELGGTHKGHGERSGAAPAQVAYVSGPGLELIRPLEAEDGDDFLARFLAKFGPGPHHLTFEMPDLASVAQAADANGFPSIYDDYESDFRWECFLSPKATQGILVQLKQRHHPFLGGEPPDWFPTGQERQSELLHVALAVVDMEPALKLYEEVLGGQVREHDDGGSGVEVSWRGNTLLLQHESELPGVERPGVHHLAFRLADPWNIAGAVPKDGYWEVEPAANFGTRLRLYQS